ncbi:MAG: DUF1847 domain-containing protein [Thermosulfidibacteraceae bacterium]|jgi:uncharacterized metal-binding protein
MRCAYCNNKVCYEGTDCFEIRDDTLEVYKKEDSVRVMADVATSIESEGYMKWCRVCEVIEFIKRMGYKRIGIAFCIGMAKEAEALCTILEKEGFEVVSVCCKVGGIMKEELGFKKIRPERKEAICNSIAQAMLLNRACTDLNLIVGLCVGHDILFSQYSSAPTTTVVVKDRVLAHNPVGALYSGYYRRNVFGV